MPKNRLRWVLIFLVALVVIGSISSLTWPSVQGDEAAPQTSSVSSKSCSTENPGVTLIVDFGKDSELDAIQKCVSGFADNGWALFEAAGVSAEGTTKYPTFACRIAGYPSQESQDCGENANFDKGYWSYFYAEPADSDGWVMSSAGAADRQPACGTFEGWVYVLADDASAVPSLSATPFVCATE